MARLTVALLAGAIALTACSSAGTTSATTGGNYSAEVGSTDLYAKAPQRFQIGVFRSSDQGVQLLTSGTIDIQITPFQGGPGTPLQGKAHYVGAPGTGADTGTPELTDPSTARGVYEFDGTAFYFTGWNLEKTLKFRNLVENKKVAVVVDELLTVCPWRPRGLEVRGVAELAKEDGRSYVKVTPLVKRSWGFR